MSATGGGTVTLVFTDLVGSTELLSQLGDDVFGRLQADHFTMLREAAAEFGGTEVKSLGDGLMLVFHSTVSAVSCAAAMQARVSVHDWGGPHLGLGLRVGVNCGDAISKDDDYFGTPVVVAKRLCDRAEGGQVLVSGLVRALVGGRGNHVFRDLGPMSLKGLADPVNTCELAWAGDDAAEHPIAPAAEPDSPVTQPEQIPLPPELAPSTGSTAFIGRAAEAARLTKALDRTRGGTRQHVMIAGEPGIGKTRLAAEIARLAHSQGMLVVHGRSDEESVVPFQPFLQTIRHYVDHAPQAELVDAFRLAGPEIARLVPELRARFPDIPEPAPADPETERYRLFEAVSSAFTIAARKRPVFLLLDDLHWADKASLLLLKHIARTPQAAAVMVVGTFRDVETARSHPLAQVLADLSRERLVERIDLKGLSPEEVNGLVTAWAGQETPPGLSEVIWRETEGHPFFCKELLRHLLETGALSQTGGGLRTKLKIEKLGIPEGVRDLVDRRLARLGEDTFQALSVSAVVGREFSVDVVRRVTRMSEDSLLDSLEEAAAAGLLIEGSGATLTYRFSHALVRGSLYDHLSRARRARLHIQIAEALEETDPERFLPELANHFFEAAAGSDVLERAIDYAVAAAESATRQLAYEDAASQYERAVGALTLRGGDETRLCRLLVALGESRWAAGEFVAARGPLARAAELADRLNLIPELAQTALVYGGPFGFDGGIENTELIDLLELALARLPKEDDPLRARVLGRLLLALAVSPASERRHELAQEGVAMARRLGDPAVLAEVLTAANWTTGGPDDLEQRLTVAKEALAMADQAGNPTLRLEVGFWAVANLLEAADMDAAARELEICTELLQGIRHPYHAWMVALAQTMRAIHDGRMKDAGPLARRALETGQLAANPNAVQLYSAQIEVIAFLEGTMIQLHAASQAFADHFRGIPAFRCGLIHICSEIGLEDEARANFETLAAHDFEDFPRDMFWFSAIALLADSCVDLGDRERAVLLYDLLKPYEDRYVVLGSFAAPYSFASRPLGRLAGFLGDHEEAERLFEKSLEAHARVGAEAGVAWTHLNYARMLISLDTPAAAERALPHMEEASELGRRLGLQSFVDQVREMREGVIQEAPRRRTVGEVASQLGSDARAAVTTRGRVGMAKLIADASDDDLERRFGSRVGQRAMFAAMAGGFQPRMALGFEGELGFELTHLDETTASDWWTIQIQGRKATAHHRAPANAEFTLHVAVPDFVRIVAGSVNPVTAWVEGRARGEGDVTLGPRLVELFGGVAPFETAASGAQAAAG